MMPSIRVKYAITTNEIHDMLFDIIINLNKVRIEG